MRYKEKVKYKIGIGIKVFNRFRISDDCLNNYIKFTPDADIFVVDDGSDTPYPRADYRSSKTKGIAKSSNRLLANLDHCDFIVLADNDCWPTVHGWHEKYIEAFEKTGCHHFSLCWTHRVDGSSLGRTAINHGDIVENSWANGVMLFMTKHCVDTIGGFDIRFGRAGYEHINHSIRAHNAGLTPYRFCDIPKSIELFYPCDYMRTAKTSIPDKHALFDKGKGHYRLTKDSREYISYR